MLKNDVLNILVHKCLVDPDKPILVGISGGPDSLMLLHVMRQLSLNLIAAHMDHKLRDESVADLQFVQEICQKWGVPLITESVDVRYYCQEKKLSLEEGGRDCRYHFLFEQAQKNKAQAVTVGHNADDQVETVLMHFLRGAGTSGLRGMSFRHVPNKWSDIIPVWRPLLGIWRKEINEYCEENSLNPVSDQSNDDTTYYRNKLRHILLPDLIHYNPKIKEVILRMSSVMQADDDLLISLTEETWKEVINHESSEMISINRKSFRALRDGLQRRILRKAIDELLPGLRDIGLDVVERAIERINTPNLNLQLDLVANIDLILNEDAVIIIEHSYNPPVQEFPQMETLEAQYLSPGCIVKLQDGWVLHAEIVEKPSLPIQFDMKMDNVHVWLNPAQIQFPLEVRAKQAGDRWRPFGLKGHSQKVSDTFINKKIPIEARALCPLVINKDEFVWMVGVQPSFTYHLCGDEAFILHLWVERPD